MGISEELVNFLILIFQAIIDFLMTLGEGGMGAG